MRDPPKMTGFGTKSDVVVSSLHEWLGFVMGIASKESTLSALRCMLACLCAYVCTWSHPSPVGLTPLMEPLRALELRTLRSPFSFEFYIRSITV